ncbi:MAG TPA: GNAT family N-acetyltransferase [Steroidobacteraceae bacterium]|nr:GNAT family N-acetyltransferase [Steroidobacteraceae bacterium]
MAALRVRRWTNEEFLAGRAAWQPLLARSDADALFMSWDWICAWWRHHGAALRAELCVLAVYSHDGALCGIAPFYGHRAVHRGFAAARRLELLGNTWRDSSAVFSEYLDVIAQTGLRDEVCAALKDWLTTNAEWDELVLCNLRDGSVAAQLADSLSDLAYVRGVESMTGWSIALPESFDSFVARLSSNTRRKVVHQREKLAGVSYEITRSVQRPAALERLDAFVTRRFGAPAGNDARTRARFHADLVEHWTNADAVHLTELRAGGNCVSVMLNVRVGGTEYYLQSGFDEAHARGLSPGLLHLGYAIEAACRDGIRRFDFLAGRGLHRDYKQDFAAESAPLHTLHVVRKPWLRALFRSVDFLRGRTSHKARPGD